MVRFYENERPKKMLVFEVGQGSLYFKILLWFQKNTIVKQIVCQSDCGLVVLQSEYFDPVTYNVPLGKAFNLKLPTYLIRAMNGRYDQKTLL